MRRSFLSRLQTNGTYYIIGALILLLVIPLYQLLILVPQGYGDALAATNKDHLTSYLLWISNHLGQFMGYRTLLIIAFICLISLPFILFRIIVAQEILGQDAEVETEQEAEYEDTQSNGEMPVNAWRGKGYAVLAAWAGLLGIICYALGTLASTLFLLLVGTQSIALTSPHGNTIVCTSTCLTLSSTFAIITNTVGGGLLALAQLFFGAIIARRGRNLWPGSWVAFSYMALATAALFSGSAVEVASAPTETQAPLTSPAILLFAIWVLWFGIMLVRLKPEA